MKLARARAPKDTGELERSISSYVKDLYNGGYEIIIAVPRTPHASGSDGAMTNLALGLKLERGAFRRSRNKPNNPKGSPTALWWTQFEQDAIKWINEHYR